jgi:phosphoribosyl 1,2-cyclic phosphate phosphodiesterase
LQRERSAIIFSISGYELLVDAPPGVLNLAAKNGIKHLDGVFITHAHFDHSAGLGELFYWERDLDLFAEPRMFEALRGEYGRAVASDVMFHLPYRPGLAMRFDGFFITPFAVTHSVPTFGLAIYENDHKVIYASDSDSCLSHYALRLMHGADVLIVNTPSLIPPHAAHITVAEAIELKERVAAKQLLLTHFNHHNKPHGELERYAAPFDNVVIAYDGLAVEV